MKSCGVGGGEGESWDRVVRACTDQTRERDIDAAGVNFLFLRISMEGRRKKGNNGRRKGRRGEGEGVGEEEGRKEGRAGGVQRRRRGKDSRFTLASYPGLRGEEKRRPGAHCLRMHVIREAIVT